MRGRHLSLTIMYCHSGYLPLHEDPEKRIHRPHPFHTATQKAKEDCDADALAKSAGSTHAAQQPGSSSTSRPTLPPLAVPEPKGQYLKAVNMSRSQGLTPVTSYVPSGGFHESPMPVGKYYPSNYERRHNSSQNPPRTSRNSLRPPSARGPSSVKSDTAVPQFNRTDSHGRSDSEATRRLQQYQRDMVAQAYLATQKATQDLAGKGGAAAALAAASMHGAPLSRFQFPGTPHRPISPRLEPMGSPGPVTPLALEGADGYWGDRPRPVPSPDAGRESQAVARAMRAEGERHRREGQHSPAVEAGGFGF
ncbi:hypothetical protein VP1G_06254 [Cytospora mali]|uniref:Uncharacterized protein n=1 Tax=Cytospora mali TaxID=578113 RepID=A0A194V4R4_CYTMA|nr:hypothetical protein VP1G_06254 [Valsa mali var. pyri (nom. inval.)]